MNKSTLLSITRSNQAVFRMNRDLFDAHFFLKNEWPIDPMTIEYRTEQKLPEYLRSLASTLRNKPPKHLLNGIGELIDEKQKKWVKASLLDELLFLLELRAKLETSA